MSKFPSPTIFNAPAIKALTVQCLALACVVAGIALAAMAFPTKPTFLFAAGMQGAVAAAISRYFKLASWWIVIQFFFPLALLGTYYLQLPPSIFLTAFAFSLALYWTTFRTQVPFYPSGRLVWNAVMELLPQDRPVTCIDIGSGLGGLVLHAAQLRPDSKFTGIEIAPLPWLVSWVRAALRGRRGDFICGDYHRLDFSQYDVVFAYLSPAAMSQLWKKARSEMRPGALLLSFEFPIIDVEPQFAVEIVPGRVALFGWYF